MTSSKVKTQYLGIRLTAEEKRAVETMAKREAMDYSGFLRMLIRKEAQFRLMPDIGTMQQTRKAEA